MRYSSLHTHTHYSLLDGASSIQALTKRAKEYGMGSIALTDHGVMSGAIELIRESKASGLKPIVGVEAYIINGDITERIAAVKRYHLILLAKNWTGYQNLVKLVTKSHLDGFYYKPRINKELLAEHSEGLICTSGCMAGEIPRLIVADELDKAYEVASWYAKTFGDDFYLEIQDHGLDKDVLINKTLIEIGETLEIKTIATNDTHFTCAEDSEAHDVLLCIQTGQKVSDKDRMKYSGQEYLKTYDEMVSTFREIDRGDVEAALLNTLEIEEKIEDYSAELFSKIRMPSFTPPGGMSDAEYLTLKAEEGLTERLSTKNLSERDIVIYRERLALETKLLVEKGFASYFLVVWDYIDYAIRNKIPVGPGRGSSAGSLVAYCLKITNVDPIRYNLLFERFLNPERVSLPDIDTDFCVKRRKEVIDYVRERHGSDKVCMISTFIALKGKSAIKDAGRVLDFSFKETTEVASTLVSKRGHTDPIATIIKNQDAEIAKLMKQPRYKKLIELAAKIEDTIKTSGTHAAGIVISGEPLDGLVPMIRDKTGAIVAQYSMGDIESLGLLKMDFLGLKAITTIDDAISMIPGLDPKEWANICENPFDQSTYATLAGGSTHGVFQMEASGIKNLTKKVEPSTLNDISLILALYRPGPLDSGMIPPFLDRKKGGAIPYEDPKLEPILADTYGTIVYQEQIMQIAQYLAGYSLGEADMMRRAMGKKKEKEMLSQEQMFMNGANRLRVSSDVAKDLFQQIILYSGYAFNRSHSAAYALISYQTAYLKTHHKPYYYSALLNGLVTDSGKLAVSLSAAKDDSISIFPPDVNISRDGFFSDGSNVYFGFGAIKGFGEAVCRSLVEERATNGLFSSFDNFLARASRIKLGKSKVETLILCGALDCFNSNRRELKSLLETSIQKKKKKEKGLLMDLLFPQEAEGEELLENKTTEDFTAEEKGKYEKKALGYYVSWTPMDDLMNRDVAGGDRVSCIAESPDGYYTFFACASLVKEIITKKGHQMGIFEVDDDTGSVEVVVFPKIYEKVSPLLGSSNVFLISVEVKEEGDEKSVFLLGMEPAEDVQAVVLNVEEADLEDAALSLWLKRMGANEKDKGFMVSLSSGEQFYPFKHRISSGNVEELRAEASEQGISSWICDFS